MTLTIGRADLGRGPSRLSMRGDQLTVAGYALPSSTSDAKALRQQLLGMVDNDDEDVFPLVFDSDGTFDGFYEVLGVSVDLPERNYTTGRLAYQVELQRIPNFARPRFESITAAVVRPNGHSITAATCNAGIAVIGANDADYATSSGVTYTVQRGGSVSDGQVYLFTDSAPFTDARVSWNAKPSEHYTQACLLEQKIGSSWYPVVGRQVRLDQGANWRISNGLLRVGPNETNGDRLDVSIRQFSPAQWETSTFTFGYYSGSWQTYEFFGYTSSEAMTATVLRNSPERVALAFDGFDGVRQTLSITAGDHHCVFRHVHTNFGSAQWGAQFASSTATSDMPTATVGVRETSNNADGNRAVIMANWAMTNDNVRGRTYRTSGGTSITMGFGVIQNGGSAVSGDQAADLTGQFMGAPSVRRRVTAR